MEYKANLFDYLKWRGDVTMEQSPFNEIDGMILARLVYAPFGLVLTDGEQLSGSELPDRTLVREHYYELKSVMELLLAVPEIEKRVLDAEDVKLFAELAKSPRFMHLYLGDFIDLFDKKEEIQFAACVVRISDKLHCVTYRGTDSTLIGWKENFNMGFICPIRSQVLAKEYLEDFAEHVRGKLLLAGHSKGGNLASYAAAFCNVKIQKRIQTVYNYDGPGFEEKVLEEEGFQRICDRIRTFVPQASMVGMLLGHKEQHQVVHSTEVRVPIQHNMYSWEVLGTRFVYEESVNSTSVYLDHTMKDWLASMDIEKRERFVEAAYSLIADTPDKTLSGLLSNWKQNSKLVLRSLIQMDEESKKTISEGMSLFFKCARNASFLPETK